jgi:hypothetical protein
MSGTSVADPLFLQVNAHILTATEVGFESTEPAGYLLGESRPADGEQPPGRHTRGKSGDRGVPGREAVATRR